MYLIWIWVSELILPLERNSVGSGNMSHCWASAFDGHLDHCFIILEDAKHGSLLRRFRVCGNMFDIGQRKALVL